MTTRIRTTARLGLLLAAAALALSACAPTPTATGSPAEAAAVSVSDAWVKSAESGMSAAFGTVANDSDRDVTVVSATSPASRMLELHETVANDSGEMVMRPIQGGFVIPARGSLDLAPGSNHIMLMDLTAPLLAGEEVTFSLTFSDGSTHDFTAPVKDYSGANENYEGGDAPMTMNSGH